MISQKQKKKRKSETFFDPPIQKRNRLQSENSEKKTRREQSANNNNNGFVCCSKTRGPKSLPFPSGRFVSFFKQQDTAAMEQIADAIMQIPPNAMDRQRALTLLAHCDKLARNGRPRVASKYAMNCGAMLFKLGPPVAQLTEAVFQRAVYLAKQYDDDVPDYMRIMLEGNNPELGDAFTWVAAIEAKLGKLDQAENHYKGAAKAIEEYGNIVELSEKILHQCLFNRHRKRFEQWERVMEYWKQRILIAEENGESDVQLLNATATYCGERANGYEARDWWKKSALYRAKKSVETCARLEAHGTRRDANPAQLSQAIDSAAQACVKAKDKMNATKLLKRAVAATAGAVELPGFHTLGEIKRIKFDDDGVRWHWALLENDDEDSTNVKKNKEAVSKDVIDFIENGEEGNSDKGDKNGLVGAPRDPFVGDEIEVATYEAVVKIGDKWETKKGVEGDEEVDGCEAVGSILLALGQVFFGFDQYKEASRPLRTASRFLAHDPSTQGLALHMLACSNFYQVGKNGKSDDAKKLDRELRTQAALAFSAAAECRLNSTDPEGMSDGVSSLLFLGRVMFELGENSDAMNVTQRALEVAKKGLGEDSKQAKEAMNAMRHLQMEVQRR